MPCPEVPAARSRAPNRCPRFGAPLLALVACALAPVARSDLPLVTETGDLMAARACKVDTWYQRDGGSEAAYVAPACNPLGFVELAAGYGRARDEGAGWGNDVGLQAKLRLYAHDEGAALPIDAALRIGAVRHTGAPHGGSAFQDLSAVVAVTTSALDDRLRVHANAGASRSWPESTIAVWALAAEYDVAPAWTIDAEIFRDRAGSPRAALGLNMVLVPDRVDAYVSGGRRTGHSDAGWYWLAGVRMRMEDALPALRR